MMRAIYNQYETTRAVGIIDGGKGHTGSDVICKCLAIDTWEIISNVARTFDHKRIFKCAIKTANVVLTVYVW